MSSSLMPMMLLPSGMPGVPGGLPVRKVDPD
jgi:hypothetical protein